MEALPSVGSVIARDIRGPQFESRHLCLHLIIPKDQN